ncbi:winged helix-turn-helix domain-containing protein [Nocardiopsis sp. NPDC049922]|uniref:winged helix-turn-helix domain-containing protein n=1 Tax=Nocardiopsis sp. NPDC049922 TaxID=3155157 RepID=UPI0033F945B8
MATLDDALTQLGSAYGLHEVARAAARLAAGHDLDVHGVRIAPAERRVWVDGTEVHLTPHEYDLLLYLAARAGTAVTRPELLREVWKYKFPVESKVINVAIGHLRAKLGESGQHPRRIITVDSVGYRFDPGEV